MHPATIIFALTYILVSLGENGPRKLDRPTATLMGAVLMVLTGALTRGEAASAVDFSTIAVLFGMMVLLAVLMQSGLPSWLAVKTLTRCRSPHVLLAVVVFTSGAASALMLNDTVCLLGTPLLLEITERAGMRTTPYLIGLATAANIGSAMTLTGNPQNIIIGHLSGWGWSGFALRMIPIGIACLVVDWLMLELLYRRSLVTDGRSWNSSETPHGPVQRRLALKSVLTFAGLIVAFLAGAPMDAAAVTAATVLLVWANRPPRHALKAVDWSLLLFFAGLFIVVEGFVRANGDLFNTWLGTAEAPSGLASVGQIALASVVGSNLFSNVPFVLIASHWIRGIGDPQFLWLLLALTSTFAGNLTLFGSVANVIVAQVAQPRSPLRFTDFLRAGVPITLVTTAIGVLMLWAFKSAGWI